MVAHTRKRSVISSSHNLVVGYDLSGCASYCQIEFLLSLIELPSFSLGLSQENVGGSDQSVPDIPALVTNDEIGETRRSKRTRMLPPIFNLYQCDAKLKAFKVEENMSINDRNVDEIYLSMRERVADNQ